MGDEMDLGASHDLRLLESLSDGIVSQGIDLISPGGIAKVLDDIARVLQTFCHFCHTRRSPAETMQQDYPFLCREGVGEHEEAT